MVRLAHVSRGMAAFVALAALVAVAGCSADTGHDIAALRNPTPTTLEPFVDPQFDDTRGVTLPTVPPGPTVAFPVTIQGGDASLSGTLSGPGGPVSGGRVRLERFVGQSSAVLEVTTGAAGHWNARGLLGGRYRVRGWRMPDLAMNSSTVLFLGAHEAQRVTLDTSAQGGVDIQAELLTPTPTIGVSVTVVALITRHEVDRDGVVQGVPLAGRVVTLDGAAGWDISTPQATVDGAGQARWTLACASTRPSDLLISSGTGVARITVPACLRSASTTATSTTTPVQPTADFPVGSHFTPPFAGPIPAGTYEVVARRPSCALVYQRFDDGAWSQDRVMVTGSDPVVLDTFAQDLRTAGDAPPCTYERTA